MPSIRSKILRAYLRHQRSKAETITLANLAQKRAEYATFARFFPVPHGTKTKPVKGDGFIGEWVLVPTARPSTIMLYIHGGGFVFNSLDVHRQLVSRIATAGKVTALSITYSLAPEYPFPKALTETLAAYKWLLKKYDAKDIVVAGDSAGGSLVLSLLHMLREEGLPNPACAIALAPATDAAAPWPKQTTKKNKDVFMKYQDLDMFIDAYFKTTPRDHPIASPFHGQLRGFPPLLIHIDKDEIMYSGAVRFAEKAKKEGVDVTLYEAHGLWHVWHLFASYIPEARTAIANIGEFIRDHTKS